jgi:hypothetical protein
MALIKLSDAIEDLRKELELAQEKGKDADLKFEVGAIEIELEVIAGDEAGVSGKVNWGIFGGGVDTKFNNASRHKLKLTLKTNKTLLVGDTGRSD